MDTQELVGFIRGAVQAAPEVFPHLDAHARRIVAGVKADADLPAISAEYHNRITEALVSYFEGSGPVTAPRNQFGQAMIYAFGLAYDLGWADGGGVPPLDADALDWLNVRVDAELGFIDLLFQQAKELRREEGFDYFTWVTAKADGYVATLRDVYNNALTRAAGNQMLEFAGDDGAESCADCQKYKGKKHRASWWVSHDAVPPNRDFECHGYNCQHFLIDAKGERFTL